MKIKVILLISVPIFLLVVVFDLLRVNDVSDSLAYHQFRWDEYKPKIDRAVESEDFVATSSLSHVYGVLLSHHIPVTIPKLVEYYTRLKSIQTVKKFIIIGPDHNDSGSNSITASNAIFSTAYGVVKPIDGLAKKLQSDGAVKIEEMPFNLDHSIGAQVLLINKIFPDAKILPIIIRSDTTDLQIDKLVLAISPLIDKETVLIGSIDFTHYLSVVQARSIDELSGEIVKKLDIDSLPLVKADSKQSVSAFIKILRNLRAFETDSVVALNTYDFNQNIDNTTGYIFGLWGTK